MQAVVDVLKDEPVRYTATLPTAQLEVLRRMVAERRISSINQGIREAVASYISELQREHYAALMSQAAEDKEFQKRTASAQRDFESVDDEAASW